MKKLVSTIMALTLVMACSIPADKLPLGDIQANPENYLDYEYAEKSDDPGEKALKEIEELKAAIERGLTL